MKPSKIRKRRIMSSAIEAAMKRDPDRKMMSMLRENQRHLECLDQGYYPMDSAAMSDIGKCLTVAGIMALSGASACVIHKVMYVDPPILNYGQNNTTASNETSANETSLSIHPSQSHLFKALEKISLGNSSDYFSPSIQKHGDQIVFLGNFSGKHRVLIYENGDIREFDNVSKEKLNPIITESGDCVGFTEERDDHLIAQLVIIDSMTGQREIISPDGYTSRGKADSAPGSDVVVAGFADYFLGEFDVLIIDSATGAMKRVPKDKIINQGSPSVHGDTLVYLEGMSRTESLSGENRANYMVIHNLTTNQKQRIPMDCDTRAKPDVYRDDVLFSSHPNGENDGQHDIFHYTKGLQGVLAVTNTADNEGDPDNSRDVGVWSGVGPDDDREIFLYHKKSRNVVVLRLPGDQTSPSISNDGQLVFEHHNDETGLREIYRIDVDIEELTTA